MTKAIIFDIDGVLIDSFEANLKFYQDLMMHTGYRPPTREEFSALFHLTTLDTIKILVQPSTDEERQKIWEMARKRKIPYDVRLITMPKNAEKVIEKLGKNYLLGILTSRVRENVYEFPGLAKLQKYFQVVIAFQNTTNHKPHPEPLLLAAQKLSVEPGDCVYIGDTENDLKAARAAGMKIIIYSQNRVENADACTSSFIKLPELVTLMERKKYA